MKIVQIAKFLLYSRRRVTVAFWYARNKRGEREFEQKRTKETKRKLGLATGTLHCKTS
jgi:hypothetical protein